MVAENGSWFILIIIVATFKAWAKLELFLKTADSNLGKIWKVSWQKI
jgi:hypothetical protein